MNQFPYKKYSAAHKNEFAPSIPTFNNWDIRGEIFINDKKFVDQILRKAKSIDAIVYTATSDLVDDLPINKLLLTQSYGEIRNNRVKVRYVKNVHTKLYLVTNKDKTVSVYVSSMNLVIPGSWHNITVKISGERAKSLKLYFNRIWSLASGQFDN